MTAAEATAWAAAVVSAIMAVASFFYAQRSDRSKREANRISEAMLEIQRKDAHDKAAQRRRTRWDATAKDTKNRRILTIECLGPADARDVSIQIDGKDPAEWSDVSDRAGNTTLMTEGAHVSFEYTLTDQMPSFGTVTISWIAQDETKERVEVTPRRVHAG